MKLLAIDSSGLVASAAVASEEKILGEFSVNDKKTHSQTLLPMISMLLETLDMKPSELDVIAIGKGPGSFTGLRIGSATAKGLCLALDRPMAEVSTLAAMAYGLYGFTGLICPIMDARRQQVYMGLYRFEGETFTEICPDKACSVGEMAGDINAFGEPVIFTGDGVPVYREFIEQNTRVPVFFAKNYQNRQRAAVLAELALSFAKEGRLTDGDLHRPEYLRLSQAERERREREGEV